MKLLNAYLQSTRLFNGLILALLFCLKSSAAIAITTVGLGSSNYSGNEDSGSISIAFTLTEDQSCRLGDCYEEIRITYETRDGSATAGSDYTAISSTLTWSSTTSPTQNIALSINPDNQVEADETLDISITNCEYKSSSTAPFFPCSPYIADGLTTSTITIINDDQTSSGTLGFATTSYSVIEGNQVAVTVNRRDGGDGAVSVDYAFINGSALAGKDFVTQSGRLQWNTNDTTAKTIMVNTLKDTILDESTETFSIRLSNPTGNATLDAANAATITISDTAQSLSSISDLTPNERALANSLDQACGAGARGEFLQLCQDLFNSDNPQQILSSIVPEQIAAQGTAANEFGFLQLQFLHGRILSLRKKSDAHQFDILGFNVNVDGSSTPVSRLAQLDSGNAYGGAAGDDNEEGLRDSPLGIFLKGQINLGNRDGTDRVKGYDIETKGITLGADYRITDEFIMGLALGYGYTDNDFSHNQGQMTTQSGDLSLYGSYFLPKDFYVDWILSYTVNSYDMARRIAYPGFVTNATSDPMGDQYGFSFGLGKDIYYESLFFSPYTRIEYLDTGIEDYSESANGGVALAIEEQSIQSVMSTLGGQMSQSISFPWGVLTPGLRAEWVHQFEDNDRLINARFIDAPTGTGNFSILTDSPDRDYFNLGGSMALTLPEGRSAYFRYETRLGQERVSNHTLELGVRMPF